MEETLPIEMNRLALKRILSSMIAMAGIAAGRATLTRSLRLAVLRILRPAEAATRRLVIAMARPLLHEAARAEAANLPPCGGDVRQDRGGQRGAQRPKGRLVTVGDRPRTGIILSRFARAALRVAKPPAPTRLSFRMLDPLRSPFRPRRPWVRQVSFPRISGFETFDRRPTPIPLRETISSADLLDVAPLARRLSALGRALDDLPARAKRFARWRARRLRLQAEGRAVRTSPLKPGRPPGGRLRTYDPDRPRRKHIREIDEILVHTHSMARYALEKPDTS